MAIAVRCECGRKLTVKDEYAGKKTKCPDCGAPLAIPAAAGATAAPAKKKKKDEGFSFDGDPVDAPSSGEVFVPKKLQLAPEARKKKSSSGPSGPVSPLEAIQGAKEPEKSAPPSYVFAIIGGVLGLCVIGGGVAVSLVAQAPVAQVGGPGAAVVPAVTEWDEIYNPDAPMKIKVPKGWESKFGGGTGGIPPFVEMTTTGVTIRCRGTQGGAARSEALIAAANQQGGPQNLPEEQRPVSVIHEEQAKQFYETEFSKFVDGPASMVEGKMGEMRISEFGAQTTFSTVKGIRATIIKVPHQYNFYLTCSAKDYPRYKPAFEEMLKTMSTGL